jgi:hypothetical protein
MAIVGDKKHIAFEIGSYWADSIQQQHITIWIGNKRINPIDDVVYLPTFYTMLKKEIDRIETNEFSRLDCDRLQPDEIFHRLEHEDSSMFQVLNYDSSTCAAICYFLAYDSTSTILFKYWDDRHKPSEEIGRVYCVEISKDSILKVMKEALGKLSDVWV